MSVENSTSCMRKLNEAHGHMGSCPGYALLILHGKASKPREDEFRERVGRIIERNLGRRSQDGYIQWQNRWEKGESERGEELEQSETGDVPEEPGNKNDEQVAVQRADASGGYIIEHEEKRMRGIRVNKRGSGATSEEQLDE